MHMGKKAAGLDGLWARGQSCLWHAHARKQSHVCTVKHCITRLWCVSGHVPFFPYHGVVQNEGSCSFLKNNKCYTPLPLTGGQHSHEVWELNKETAVSFLHSLSVHFILCQENLCLAAFFFQPCKKNPSLFYFIMTVVHVAQRSCEEKTGPLLEQRTRKNNSSSCPCLLSAFCSSFRIHAAVCNTV